mgnify:CR=1 FL=1
MTSFGIKPAASAGFGDRLYAAMRAYGPVCVGIDPHAGLLQEWGLDDDANGVREFSLRVIEALGGTLEKDDVTQLDVLTGLTGVPAPAPLAALAGKTPRFDRVVDKADILSTVALLKDL